MSVQYEYITQPSRADEVCKKLMEAKNVGGDTEATGVDPHVDKVTLLSLASRQHGAFVIDTRDKRNLEAFGPLFESEETIKTFHNFSYDYKMILGTAGIEVENAICTMLGERTLTAGQQFGGASLDAVTKKYKGIERDKSLQKSFIGYTGESTPQQRIYSAEDALYLLDIAEAQQQKAKDAGVLKIWRIESNAIQAFSDIEYYGQLISKSGWEEVMRQNAVAAEAAKQQLDYFFEPYCNKMMEFDQVTGDGKYIIDMNYESVPMVLHCLKLMGVSADGQVISNTSKKTQNKIKEHPVIIALTKYRQAMQGLKMFGVQYVKAIHPVTGRVHFRFKQYGTDTGRPSCGNEQAYKRGDPKLNCLNIPRDNRYRNCFGTDPDRLLSTVDYSGAELRIMAELSGDPLMVQGFNSGVDFHCFVASMMFKREVTKKNENAYLRTPTKELNFGIAYGMGPKSLCEKLNGNGYKITIKDATDLYYKYLDTFKTTIAWLNAQKKHASTHFKMSNMNGRTRHWYRPNVAKIREEICAELEKKRQLDSASEYTIEAAVREKLRSQLAAIEREGANCQIQSVNADFSKVAMHRSRKEFKKRGWGPNTPKGARTYNMVYDEIVYDFHKDFAEEGHALQKKVMLEAANEMLVKVPMEVEGHLAPVWQK